MFFDTFTINLKTVKREQFINITDNVLEVVKKANAKMGSCKIFIPHTTAAVTIQENADPDVVRDVLMVLSELIPQQKRFLHSEGNSDSHTKSAIIGCSLEIPIDKNTLLLGQWQGIFFCEFDGPRTRKVIVQIIGQ
jgi:secondary thiamine-phosphate synthase enzyme